MASISALGCHHRLLDLHVGSLPILPAAGKTTLTVAVARQPGTPATEVSREVGRMLGWPVYDHELVEWLAARMHVSVSQVEALDEKAQSWLMDCLEGFVPTAGCEMKYVHHLRLLLQSLAEQGNAVIVGRGAAQWLRPTSTLRVLLVANPEDQVRVVSRRLHVSSNEAARLVHQKWRQQTTFVRKYYHKDPTQMDNYDLVLNTSRWPVARCACVIAEAALQRRREGDSSSSPDAR